MYDSWAPVEDGDQERGEDDVVVEVARVVALQVDRRDGDEAACFGEFVHFAAAAAVVACRAVED